MICSFPIVYLHLFYVYRTLKRFGILLNEYEFNCSKISSLSSSLQLYHTHTHIYIIYNFSVCTVRVLYVGTYTAIHIVVPIPNILYIYRLYSDEKKAINHVAHYPVRF